jgi:hypothetical protein
MIRGLHYQHPSGQAKLVAVLDGEIWDVAVDMRRGSPSVGEWFGIALSAENGSSCISRNDSPTDSLSCPAVLWFPTSAPPSTIRHPSVPGSGTIRSLPLIGLYAIRSCLRKIAMGCVEMTAAAVPSFGWRIRFAVRQKFDGRLAERFGR